MGWRTHTCVVTYGRGQSVHFLQDFSVWVWESGVFLNLPRELVKMQLSDLQSHPGSLESAFGTSSIGCPRASRHLEEPTPPSFCHLSPTISPSIRLAASPPRLHPTPPRPIPTSLLRRPHSNFPNSTAPP